METIAALFVPHGIFEIPALILVTAAALQMGLMMATPFTGKTVGETFLESLGKWCRVALGLALPLLLFAAVVEIWVTPQIALKLLP